VQLKDDILIRNWRHPMSLLDSMFITYLPLLFSAARENNFIRYDSSRFPRWVVHYGIDNNPVHYALRRHFVFTD